MIISKSMNSLSFFLADVSELSKDWKTYWIKKRLEDDHSSAAAWLPWFRGEDNAGWSSAPALQPKLYRNSFDTKLLS